MAHQAKLKEHAKRWRRDGGAGAREARRVAGHLSNNRLRQSIWDRYGRVCACCGEDNPVFLTLDHINGGGAKERQQLRGMGKKWAGGGGVGFYAVLRRRGFPDGYQTLCQNCNVAKHRLGICPHQAQIKALVDSVGVLVG